MADLELQLHGPVATLLLNRPQKRNAITVAMWRDIPRLLEDVIAQENVKLLVVRGAGAQFAAGADIAEFETIYASPDAAIANHMTIQAAMHAIENFPLPTFALIEGACVGGGCGLALACDIRLANTTARLGITPGKLGLMYGVADTWRLIAAVGVSQAKLILFSGRLMDAAEALRIGLVDAVASNEDFDALVTRHVDEIVNASGFTARATKSILRQIKAGAIEDTEESRALFAAAFEGEDFQEGYQAFMEKRAPKFP